MRAMIHGQVWRGFTSGRMVLVDLAMERDYLSLPPSTPEF